MKKIISGIITGILAVSISVSASSLDTKVFINGKNADFVNSPYISQNRVFVPMRDLFETIGATVSWDESTNCATATLGGKTISFKIGSNVVTQNGKDYICDVSSQLVDGKTFVPLRIILELLNFDVHWDGENNEVEIVTPPSNESDKIENENQSSNQNNVSSASEYELKVLELVNSERKKHGLSSLVWDEGAAQVASAHSKDMADRNFFSHTNPDGKSPFDRLKAYGVAYKTAAENIAAGQATPQEVFNSWMNSDGHRTNILNKNVTKLGIGYYKSSSGYKHYWTQCFIG